jgi:dihydropteroate synthase
MYSEFVQNKFLKKIEVDVPVQCFGIINLTPDSFSDGSLTYSNEDYQLQKVNEHIRLNADVIDIGAQSTKPNANPVSAQEEFERLLSFLQRYQSQLPLSLDCFVPELIEKVFSRQDLSKDIAYINDVCGMQNEKFIEKCVDYCNNKTKFIAMHSKGGIPPVAARDLASSFYDEDGGLENHMLRFFEQSITLCEKYSINQDRLILDPGFGFAKNFQHSFELIEIIPKLKKEFGLPIFVGTSRKSFLKLWDSKIEELGFEKNCLDNEKLDLLTLEFNSLLTDVDYFRMHA